MGDPEKLTALKEAYAEIILNTAKEAARRVMASERTTRLYQQELCSLKDDAIQMLLGLKQMFDSKVKEAEMASLSQQKKIEELEAQLGEAEDIVQELRKELQELQNALEKVACNQTQQLCSGVPNANRGRDEASFSSLAKPNDDLSLRSPVITHSSAGKNGLVAICNLKDSILNGTRNEINPVLPSILRRCQERGMERNGCAQRAVDLENGTGLAKDDVKDSKTNSRSLEDLARLAEAEKNCDSPVDGTTKTARFKDKTSGSTNEILVSPTDKFLSYTFTRKRKRESLSSSDKELLIYESLVKRKNGDSEVGRVTKLTS